MIVGYVRTSVSSQNPDRQIKSLNDYGCEKLYIESASAKTLNRKILNNLISKLKTGDTLVVDSFCRLCRSVTDLLSVVDFFDKKKISLVSIHENIDFSSPAGKMMITMIGAVNQFEREIISQRTKEGLSIAKINGRIGGRPKCDNYKVERALELYDEQKLTINQICENVGISTATLNRRIKKRKEENNK